MTLCEEFGLVSPDPLLQPFNEAVLAGEYSVPLTRPKPVILDIGACVGAFTVWAHKKWPSAAIHAYEPNPALQRALFENVDYASGVTLHSCAVVGQATTAQTRLYLGKDNAGQSSTAGLAHKDAAKSTLVDVIGADELPLADFIKIDAEGVEWDILERLHALYRLNSVSAIAYEYHSLEDRNRIEKMLLPAGFHFHGGQYLSAVSGVQRWVRR